MFKLIFTLSLFLFACKENPNNKKTNEAATTASETKVKRDPIGTEFPDTVKYWKFAELVRYRYNAWEEHDTAYYKRVNEWAPLHHDFKEGDYQVPELLGTGRLTFSSRKPFQLPNNGKNPYGIWSVDIHGKNLRRLIPGDTLARAIGGSGRPRYLLSRSQDLRYLIVGSAARTLLWDFKTNTRDTIHSGGGSGKARFTKDEKYILYYTHKGVRRYHMKTGKSESWNFEMTNGLFFRNDKYIISLEKGSIGKYSRECFNGEIFRKDQPCKYRGSIDVRREFLNSLKDFPKTYTSNSSFQYVAYNSFGLTYNGKFAFFMHHPEHNGNNDDMFNLPHFIMVDIEKGYTGNEEKIPNALNVIGSIDPNIVYIVTKYGWKGYPPEINKHHYIASYNRTTKELKPIYWSIFGLGGIPIMTYSVNPK